jgi:hypothetical protein
MASDGSSATYKSAGFTAYDIYKVDTTKLFFGASSSGSGESEALRPTQLNPAHYYR